MQSSFIFTSSTSIDCTPSLSGSFRGTMMIASTGHMPEQLGHAMHLFSNTLAFAFFLGTMIASVGHTFWHAPQLMHNFLIT
jgi:hypothetical protein